jgi:GrpB-like predicted nucleotidyltransferase (UPF0157 family)
MSQASIELSEYSSEWPSMFQAEKERLLSLVESRGNFKGPENLIQ